MEEDLPVNRSDGDKKQVNINLGKNTLSVQETESAPDLTEDVLDEWDDELKIERVDSGDSEDESMEEEQSPNKNCRDPVSLAKAALLLSAQQKYEVFKFKVENPKKRYPEMAQIFSSKFQARIRNDLIS